MGVDKLEPIAVVGFSMRFPEEATSSEGFWKMLLEGRSVMKEVPLDRFNINGFYHPNASHPDTVNCRGGHFLKGDIAAFDAPFFSMNPSEVESMDPQQRCLLETSYHALENAGIPIQEAAGSKTSVYVGCNGVEYNQLFDLDEEIHPMYKATGTGSAILSNRLSWFYDFRGPSITIETACSSSMVSIHLACQSLRAHESEMSLVCGSQLYLDPLTNAISLSTLQFMSPDSRCYSFDDRGNGYAKGEGFGVLVLKPLADAVAAGNTIRAVIRSSATNQDGRTPGLTQPSQAAQENQIREAYQVGGLDFRDTRLFEAHGTGTILGDTIEAGAIAAVFQKYRDSENPMYVGAVKSIIGHLEAAAGIAGVIKVILCLEKGIIPPNAGFKTLNPRIKADKWHLRFPTRPIPWPTRGLRRASINSFGYGGTNAHIVLDDAYNYLRERHIGGYHCTVEEPPDIASEAADAAWDQRHHDVVLANDNSARGENANELHEGHSNGKTVGKTDTNGYVFVWSAAEARGVDRLGSIYREYLSNLPPGSQAPDYLVNLAYTLSNRRSVLPWKSYLLANSLGDLQAKLEKLPQPSRSSLPPKVYFVFTGQGAQWARMGLELLNFLEFRRSLVRAESHFKSLGSTWSLIEELGKPDGLSRLDDPALAQPICTALQVALIELLAVWNIQPCGIVGHSSGEIAAAFCAGAISGPSAWTIAYFRGSLAARLATTDPRHRGAMMSVQLSERDFHSYFEDIAHDCSVVDISIACENSPSSITVTGLEASVDRLKNRLDRDGVFARKLRIPVAYHSVHMQVIASEYLEFLRPIAPPETPILGDQWPLFISSVTGDSVSLENLCLPEYWVENLVSKVKFSEAVKRLHSMTTGSPQGNQINHYIEIGPHAVLQRPIKDTLSATEGAVLYDSTLRRGSNSLETLSDLAGRLFVGGYPVNLEAANSHGSRADPARMLTDLPNYPFNHSQRYWLESRLFRNYRQRDSIRHELLGLPCLDWNPLKARWRHTLRISDLPWLKDHQMNGAVVYPAAGMLVMVVEAARAISKQGFAIQGYRFRDVTIFSALVIPPEVEGLEVQLYMENQGNSRTTGISSIECRRFSISCCSDNEWKDVCSGTIVTEYVERSSGIYDSGDDALKSGNNIRARFQEYIENCTATTSKEQFYKMGSEIGCEFGPAFQTLRDVRYDPEGHSAVGTIVLDDWMTKSPLKTVQDHVIHPTALDGVLQTVAVLTSKGGTVLGPLQAPTQFRELWLSNDLLLRRPNAEIQVAARARRVAIRDIDASIIALHSQTSEPALLIDGYRATTISSHQYKPSERRNIIYSVEWRPDVEMLSRSEKEQYCLRDAGTQLVWDPSKKAVCLYYMTQALQELEGEKFRSPEVHIQKYLDWIRFHVKALGDRNPLLDSPWKEIFAPGNRGAYLSQFAARGRVEKSMCKFCSQLTRIIRGKLDPLDLLFNQGIAKDLYSDSVFDVTGKRAASFINLVSHKYPDMDILEIGAGTGSMTEPILSAISRRENSQSAPRYNSYTFTDISPSFFEKAKERFASHGDRILFKTLDIEQDPTQQGFESGKYQLVFAGMVFHATAKITQTLEHARSLLQPGGHLVLIEATNKHSTITDGIWGTLPGWWRGTEDDRRWSPLYSQSEWEMCLKQTGFIGIELALPDHSETEHHILSLLVSRVASIKPSQVLPFCGKILSANTELQKKVAADVSTHMKSIGAARCDIISAESLLTHDDKNLIVVSLLELEDTFLSSMTEDGLASLKKTVDSSSQIYWITSGGGTGARTPEKAMSSGFGRAIMQEYPGLRFASIDVSDPAAAAETFQRVFKQSSLASDTDDWETDYLESEGLISIPRVAEANDINDFVHSQTGRLDLEKMMVGKEPSKPLKLEFTFGQLDSFRFDRDESVNLPLAGDEVEVQVSATGINFTDVMVILGQMSGSYIGCEYSGVVRRVGFAVTTLSPGDRVCGMGSATFKTLIRTREYATARIPDTLPFTEAFPAVYLTAIYGINHLGRLRKGESILIHAAAGAVGQTALQLAKRIGADIFVTVSSVEKRNLIKRVYEIPDSRIFFSRNLSFGRQVMHATDGRGVDVVLNSLSGEGLAESWRVLAPLGRFVEIGKRDIHTFQSLPMQPFSKNVSYHSVDLETVDRYNPGFMRQMVKEMEEMLSSGTLSPPQPVSVFSRAEFEPAIRYLQTGRHMGKAVIDWEARAEIPIVPSPDPRYSFDPGASYVIAGGLGGIGRSLARWFAERGAKYLILLSRSGPKSESATKLLEDLVNCGVNVATPRCDITDTNSLETALRGAAETMPPVRGCIQGSMVLKDRLLQNMTWEEWRAVLGPKITGTWNLHDILPRKMDFFVILSSLGGMIGSSGQSQYNAASTFQDAFARRRWSLGEKCISVDVGLVTGVGYVAEHSNIARRWNEKGLQNLHEKEVHSIMDWACNPCRKPSSPWLTQIITAVGKADTPEKHYMDSLPHLKRPMYRQLLRMNRQTASASETRSITVDYRNLLRGAKGLEEAGSIVVSALAQRLSRALSVPQEDIDINKPVHSYGVDSLVAVELRFWFANEMKADISVFNILANDNIKALGQLAAGKSEYFHKSAKDDISGNPTPDTQPLN
ncbi:hypothetical protein F5Y05DRAFT_410453 [Hypoxylon sp. FL0543]|nr:hypothetical protein F5Y05DRAFT_410453 [Hypoxylon sp. FL0543]